MNTQQTTQTDLALTVAMQANADLLTITYTVANRGTSDLFLFNRLYKDYDPVVGYRTDVNLAAIELRGDRVVVSKKQVAIPDDVDVEAPIVPCVTLVAPGASMTETFRLPLPLKPWTSYEQGTSSRDGVRAPEFELGYFLAPADARDQAKQVKTGEGAAWRLPHFPVAFQLVAKVGPFDPVPTLED